MEAPGPKRTEKGILRRAAEAFLPAPAVWRNKEKFAVGAWTGDILGARAERTTSGSDFQRHRVRSLVVDLRILGIVDQPNWVVGAYLPLAVFEEAAA